MLLKHSCFETTRSILGSISQVYPLATLSRALRLRYLCFRCCKTWIQPCSLGVVVSLAPLRPWSSLNVTCRPYRKNWDLEKRYDQPDVINSSWLHHRTQRYSSTYWWNLRRWDMDYLRIKCWNALYVPLASTELAVQLTPKRLSTGRVAASISQMFVWQSWIAAR
jgi:hypothetical protein